MSLESIQNDVREFRIRAEYRRACVYIIVGLAATPLILYILFSNDTVQLRRVVCTAIPLIIAAMIPFRWRLRIDPHGVSRRRLFGWSHWPWTAFESGAIDKATDQLGFTWSALPWWKRTIVFDFLEADEIETAHGMISARWFPPPPASLPERLTIGWRGFSKIQFSRKGIELGRQFGGPRYSWMDVKHLRIARLEHNRRDFREMDLELPDRTITFRVTHQHGVTGTSWSGATPQLLNSFLLAHVSADRVTVISLQLRPRTEADVQERLKRVKRSMRTLHQLYVILGLVAVVAFGIIVWDALSIGSKHRTIYLTIMSGAQLIVFTLYLRYFRASLERQKHELSETAYAGRL